MAKIIYKNLEAERAKLELNQTDFAKKIGIATKETYVRRLRNGGWTPQELKLLRVMGSLDYLLEHY